MMFSFRSACILTGLLILSVLNIAEAQEQCGTTIDSTNLQYVMSLNSDWRERLSEDDDAKIYGGTTMFVPVQIHIIRNTDGTGGISAADALEAFDRLNEYYIHASIHFYQCSAINYIDDDTYSDYDKTEMNALDAAHSVDDVINLYVADNTTSGASSICGHAQFPGGLDFVIQATSCMKNGSTLAHEVGHYLGLYHTHETAFGAEAVDGSDCSVDGDLLCDTPADPGLSSSIDEGGCIYTGADTDENGASYSPSVTNLMSYTAKECRYEITEDQLDRILWTLQTYRAYLTCTAPTLEASFYATPEETCSSSKEIEFYNTSKGEPTSYSWNFGDGIGTSTSESPSYTYSSKGIYTVTLTVGDGATTDNFSMNVVVGAVTLPYYNDFEAGTSSLDQFEIDVTMKNDVEIDAAAAESGSYGLVLDGYAGFDSPYFETPTSSTAFGALWNPYYKASASLCVNATYYEDLQLEFDMKQLYGFNSNYTNLRITVNGSIVGSVYQVSADDPSFTHITIDLSAYDGQVITLGFEGSHKYDKDYQTTNGSATFIDNIEITGTPIASIWNGSVSADWNTSENWTPAGVPTSSDVAVVPIDPTNQPHVTLAHATPAECDDLIIESGAILTVDAGKALTVHGDTDNDGTILVKADASAIGSFLDDGTITGAGSFEMEQYLYGAGGATPNSAFWYVGSPVSGATSSVYDAGGTNKLWSANEVTQSYTEITDNTSTLNVGEGYVARVGATGTHTFVGNAFNTGSVNISGLTRTGTNATNRGYNLVSNPYPSAINWYNASRTNLETTMWFRTNNGVSMVYDTYNATSNVGTNNNGSSPVTRFIPPTQAFWVRVPTDGLTGQLSLDYADRDHIAQNSIYKVAEEEGTIRIALTNGNVSDEQIILFNPAASDGYDDFDSQKFWSSNVPQLYTNLAEDTLTINGMSNPQANPSVPLGMKLPVQGDYALNATSITFTETNVYLEDTESNIFQDLNVNPSYNFNSNAGNVGNRFILHFGMSITGIEDGTEWNSRVYANNGNQLNIILSEGIEDGNVWVLDMTGRIVHAANLTASSTILNIDASTGTYLIRVETAKGSDTHSVIINQQ